jgi:hypothetical protein
MKPVTFLILVFADQPMSQSVSRSLWLGDETCDISHPRVRRSADVPKCFKELGWVMKPVTFLILVVADQPMSQNVSRSLWLGDETCDISHPRVRRSADVSKRFKELVVG